MNKEISSFIDRYVKEIKNNSAAMFIGAGFSKSAGYVDWKNLLKDVADDLELDIDLSCVIFCRILIRSMI